MALLRVVHDLQSPHSFPPAYHRRHKHNRPPTCNVLRNQEKTSSCRLVAVISHSALPSPKTPRCFLSFPFSHPEGPWGGSRHTPLLSLLLYSFDTFSNPHPFCLGSASSDFFISSFFHGLSSIFLTFSSHCQCFAHSFLFASQRSDNLASSSSFLQDLCSSSPCCRPSDFVQESSASLRTLDHVRHFWLVPFLHLFLLIFFFISSNHTYHFCMVSSHPGWIHAFSQSAANSSETHHRLSASILPFDLIFFVRSFIIFILCCCFISSSSSFADSSCLLCSRCKLCSLNMANVLAQQSSLLLTTNRETRVTALACVLFYKHA